MSYECVPMVIDRGRKYIPSDGFGVQTDGLEYVEIVFFIGGILRVLEVFSLDLGRLLS